jgi:hypothetical protein
MSSCFPDAARKFISLAQDQLARKDASGAAASLSSAKRMLSACQVTLSGAQKRSLRRHRRR